MDQLPLDIKVALMLNIDEFTSLWGLIQTSSSTYEAFSAARKTILSAVLRNALGPELLCNALALNYADRITSREYFTVKNYLTVWASPRQYPEPDSTGFNGVARRHALVEWCQRDMCLAMAHKVPYNQPSDAVPGNLAPSEIVRVHRAIYRFELYAVLFADKIYPHVDYEDQIDMYEARELYLDRLPPWEVEELSCVHAYLHGRLEEQVDCGPEPEASIRAQATGQPPLNFLKRYSTRERLLSYGLEFLYSVFKAPENRKRDIIRKKAGFGGDQRFLGNVLRLRYPVSNLTRETPDFSELLGATTCHGPGAGWSWIHQDLEPLDRWRICQTDVRSWGYCLWDRRRLERLVPLDEPFDETKYYSKVPKKNEEESLVEESLGNLGFEEETVDSLQRRKTR